MFSKNVFRARNPMENLNNLIFHRQSPVSQWFVYKTWARIPSSGSQGTYVTNPERGIHVKLDLSIFVQASSSPVLFLLENIYNRR